MSEDLDKAFSRATLRRLLDSDFVWTEPLLRKALGAKTLIGANLSCRVMHRADLRWATLCGVNLHLADLSKASLVGADLRGADLSNANLSGANFVGADLSGADLSGASLSGANLRYTRGLTAAQLVEAWSLEGTKLPEDITREAIRAARGRPLAPMPRF